MIEIMTPQRYVALGGAVRAAEDETGILWREAWLASDDWDRRASSDSSATF